MNTKITAMNVEAAMGCATVHHVDALFKFLKTANALVNEESAVNQKSFLAAIAEVASSASRLHAEMSAADVETVAAAAETIDEEFRHAALERVRNIRR